MIESIKEEYQGIFKSALNRYCTPYGKPNPETYAYLAGAVSLDAKEYWQSLNTSLLDALKELVELKDLKDSFEALRPGHVEMRKDYFKRKPLAWEAARKAISSASGGGNKKTI